MSRASVASATARAGARRDFAFFRNVPLRNALSFRRRSPRGSVASNSRFRGAFRWIAKARSLRAADLEVIVRWGVPATLFAFVLALIAISFGFTCNEQERVVAAATTDIDLIASVIADDINVRLRDMPGASPTEALAHAIPLRAFKRGQRVLLSDQSGTIVAGYPDSDASGSIADRLGAAQPLAIFGEKAGVMRLTLPDGTEALATVRGLQEPLGQLTVLHPMPEVLHDWRSALTRTCTLLGCVAIVLAALAIGYFWQASRARQAAFSCRNMRDRVDMALSRGRCGLWDWNLVTGAIDWSLSMYEIIGMAPGPNALSFAEINALIHPEDGGLDALAQSLGPGSTVDHIFRIRNSRSDWTWIRAKAELVHDAKGTHLVGIAIDITETMALEERSAKADMRLRDAIETISEAFVIWDADNRLVMCNSKFQRFHHLPSEAVAVGSPYAAVMECGTPPIIQSQIAVGEQQPMGARTFEAQLGDGRWLQINERRTKDGGYVSVGTDITALKRNEAQLLESERQLLTSIRDLEDSRQVLETQKQQLGEIALKYKEQKSEAEKANRAKSDFLANMSHELRTPLNAILGFSEVMMLETYGKLGAAQYGDYCRHIHISGQYLLGVIADVLEMSRLDAGRVLLEKDDFSAALAIDTAVRAVSNLAEANAITIAVNSTEDAKLLADRSAVEKILTILLNNAVKYTPANGRVSVRTQVAQGAMNFHVEDTGVGIAADEIDRLGKPFEQSEQALRNGMRGSGLGLAIARSLVELHGGLLKISSQPNVGTLVVVSLPNRRSAPPPRLQIAATNNVSPARLPRSAVQSDEKKTRKISRTA